MNVTRQDFMPAYMEQGSLQNLFGLVVKDVDAEIRALDQACAMAGAVPESLSPEPIKRRFNGCSGMASLALGLKFNFSENGIDVDDVRRAIREEADFSQKFMDKIIDKEAGSSTQQQLKVASATLDKAIFRSVYARLMGNLPQ